MSSDQAVICKFRISQGSYNPSQQNTAQEDTACPPQSNQRSFVPTEGNTGQQCTFNASLVGGAVALTHLSLLSSTFSLKKKKKNHNFILINQRRGLAHRLPVSKQIWTKTFQNRDLPTATRGPAQTRRHISLRPPVRYQLLHILNVCQKKKHCFILNEDTRLSTRARCVGI